MYKKLDRSLDDEELREIDDNFRTFATSSGGRRLGRKIVDYSARIVFKCVYRIRVSGRHRLPLNESFFLCSNHVSHMDHAALIVASDIPSDRFVAMAARDYFFRNPRLCHVMSMLMGIVPVDRRPDSGSLSRNLRYLEKCRNSNKNILYYPEGTRSNNGDIGRFRSGIGFFAARLKLKVVPAYVKGTFDCLPKGRRIPHPGTITVAFGDALTVSDTVIDKDDVDNHRRRQEFVELLRKNVIQLGQKLP